MVETTNIKLKKWQSTDLVTDMLTWLNSNADTIDANISLLQIGTLTSAYHSNVTLLKLGRLVVIQTPPSLIQSLPGNTSTNIGTIPVGFMPVSTVVWFNPQVNATANRLRVQILMDGTISVYPYSTSAVPVPTELALCGTYVTA